MPKSGPQPQSGAMADKSRRRLLLVDDHPILREGFAHLIDREPSLKVCAQTDNATQALEDIAAQKPDLVIVEVALKGINGIELIKRIKILNPQLPVLVLSAQDEALFAERALRAGARGYVMKQAPTEDVMTAIWQLLRGGRYLSREMQERVMENLSENGSTNPAPDIQSLSDRELEVFQLVGNGCGTRQIAEHLHVSIKTVESYRAHIKKKLKLRNGMELIRMAVQNVTD